VSEVQQACLKQYRS